MWNLIKNSFRSLKKNKLNMVGLTFLTFISTTAFTTLNSTTTSINREYNQISSSGNLHDVTVSQVYDIGIAKYRNDLESQKMNNAAIQSFKTYLYNTNHLVKTSDNLIAPYVKAIKNSDTNFTFTMFYLLDINDIADHTAIKEFYLNVLNNEEEWNSFDRFLAPIVTITVDDNRDHQQKKLYDYATSEQQAYGKDFPSQTTNKDLASIIDLINHGFTDTGKINEKLKESGDELYQYAATKDTPLDEKLRNDYKHQLTFRDFSSLEISNSADNIFYKAVSSNKEDTIDKLVNLPIDNNPNGLNWGNFSVKDATYNVLDYKNNNNYSLGRTISYLPSQVTTNYDIHYFEKVQLLKKGNFPDTSNNLKKKLDELPLLESFDVKNRQKYWADNQTKLQELLTVELNSSEEVFVKDNRVTITWTFGDVPAAWEIDNWTAWMANVNPEYLQAKSKKTLNQIDLTSNKKFKNYIEQHQSAISDLKTLFIDWMNSMSYPDIEQFLMNYVQNHQDQVITPGGQTPYLIIGSGITPDFIYPIVNIAHTTPNPNKECIYFTNQAGYYRIYDSFRSNATEDYVVIKFNSGVDNYQQQKILNEINDFAASEMILPHGVKAAYFANDISNTLNASAFRITFIPKFIKDINYVSYTLTIFIILLALVICAIVINRYITINQSVLGIMQANGLSKTAIAFSMLPFALIPSLVGSIAGVILGFGLQYFVLGLLSNYWMLPTPVLSINIWSIIVSFGIALIVFMGEILLTSYWVLNKKTVDIMKTDSQDNPNIIAKSMKSLAKKFGIITRFRISVAFSSIWKLIVLAVMSSMVMSSLVFAFSINGKFNNSINATNNSRNYSFAIKLATPTKAGGQYIPTRYDFKQDQLANGELFKAYGVSGFNVAGNDERDNVYLQPLYWGDGNKTINFDLSSVIPLFPSIGITFEGLDQEQLNQTIENKDLNDLIEHEYYYSSFVVDIANHLNEAFTTGITNHANKFRDAMMISNAEQTKSQMMGNLFTPFMGDATGQLYDIFYLKNRIMTNATLDYVVGFGSEHSNPWDISASLMPENVRSSAISCSQSFLDYLGEALQKTEFTDPNKKLLHDRIVAGFNPSNFSKFKNEDLENVKKQLVYNNTTKHYQIDRSKATGSVFGVSLNFELIHLLAIGYSFGPAAILDFPITYNTVPLKDEDETYTYIDANEISNPDSVNILGIKASENHYSKYINLTDSNGNNLIQELKYSEEDLAHQVPFPIIVNAYAAHKYNLSVGSKITFKINNRADRIEHDIKVENHLDDANYINQATFAVKGINTSYENEEYFTNQDVANYLLQLKSHLTDDDLITQRIQPDSWYSNEEKSMGNNANIGYPKDKIGFNTDDGLINISKIQAKDHDQYQLTPYGFNGVFTKDENGSALLSKGMFLYSPSGLYLANDKVNSDNSLATLKFGVNSYMTAKMLGLLDTPIGKNIKAAYEYLLTHRSEAGHKQLESYVLELAKTIEHYYGTQVYQTLVTGANDKFSSNLVYTRISSTVNEITKTIIIVVSIMTIIIIALITSMIINDSKKLAAILKALGYTDNQNAATYLSIYIPVIIIGLLLAIGTSLLLISIYNQIVFSGIGIWLNAYIKWYYYLYVMSAVIIVFIIAGINGVYSIKRDKLIEAIK